MNDEQAVSTGEPEIEGILSFWFAPENEKRWFVRDPDFDHAMRETLAAPHRQATNGDLEHWRSGARGSLALVLLFDQVPRNLYRGDARAFAFDARARAIADAALAQGFDQLLSTRERKFLYMPFQHSEDMADQDRSVALFATLNDDEALWFAERHREIISRFGRFPHRNAVLARQTTAQEEAFLKEPHSSF